MKQHILFINYLIWKPEHSNFSYKYEMFSRNFSGIMLHMSYEYTEQRCGDFVFQSCPYLSNLVARQIFYLFFCIRRAMQLKSIDYIIAYDPLITGLIGSICKKLTGAKLIIEVNTNHFHGIAIQKESFKAFFKRIFMNISFRCADGIKFNSAAFQQDYERIFRLSSCGIPIEHFLSYIPTQVFVKHISDHDNYILLVGSPYAIKGVDILIQAFNKISSKYPDVMLKIIGHCDDRTPYEKLAAGNPRIIMLPGIEFDKIIPEYERCRFFVLASRTEGISRALVEAMSCGKAVIGSDVGGIPEIIEDGVNGLLFPSEDINALAEKMCLLLDHPELAEKMGATGYEMTEERYGVETYMQRYGQFLSMLS